MCLFIRSPHPGAAGDKKMLVDGRTLGAEERDAVRLLRARRERPSNCRAAEQRDELAAAAHSITSSARPSSGSGTVRPSALAVFRLITSSYLFGACTGRSAGFSPLRMRSTYSPHSRYQLWIAAGHRRRQANILDAPPSVLFWILADEPIAVGHLHLGQSLCVHRIIFTNYLIERENIGGERVYLVVRERLRLLPRHRTPRVIEYGRGIRPIVADQLYRIAIGGIERTTADQRTARAAATLLAMAGRAAVRGVDGRALRRCPAAGRKAAAVGPDADVLRCEIIRSDRLSESRRISSAGNAHSKSQSKAHSKLLKHRHGSPRPWD